MTFLIEDRAVRDAATEADGLAGRNWRANAAALAERCRPVPGGPSTGPGGDLTWVFARDGYLTCFEPGERWYAGCSVPLLAARAMLAPLDGSAGVACFLAPTHAAQVRVALDRVQPGHAVKCVVPDARALGVMLHCDDFSDDIARGRLWFVAGGDWAGSLAELLAHTPGLSTPTRFVRMPDADAAEIDRLICEAQRVFGDANASRAAAIAALRDGWTPARLHARPAPAPHVCVIARSAFRLWDDAGHALWSAVSPAHAGRPDAPAATWSRFDPDEPAASSPLALAMALAGSDAVISADFSRGEAPPRLAPDPLPWITWVTTPRVPVAASAGPNDRLLLADPAWRDDALRAGWPARRVGVAGWPGAAAATDAHAGAAPSAHTGEGLALVADTSPLDVPDALAEFSSHGLLWEKVRRDVLRDAFAVPADVAGFVRAHARAEGIDPDTLDLGLFARRLVVPAYQQALADALLAAGLPVRLHGAGWPDLPRFAPHATGPVTSRAGLRDAIRAARAVVHAWPGTGTHPLDATGRAVVRRTGVRRETFLRDARHALEGTPHGRRPAEVAPLSPSLVLDAIRP